MPRSNEPLLRRSSRAPMDSGWVRDGHELHWDDHGHWLEHPEHCPRENRAGLCHYLCNPGVHEDSWGITSDDFADEDQERLNDGMGAEPFEWRLFCEVHNRGSAGVEYDTKFLLRLLPEVRS